MLFRSPLSTGFLWAKEIPTFKINLPDNNLIKVIRFISEKDGRRKKEIVDYAFKEIFKEEEKDNAKRYMKTNRQIIDKLINRWNLITVEGTGKNSTIKLNKNGEEMIKFLG